MDYEKELKEARERVKSFKVGFENADELNDWLNALDTSLADACAESLRKLPEAYKDSCAQVLFMGIGRFTCHIIAKVQREGMVKEGVDMFSFYSKVLLPMCHEGVLDEIKHVEAEEKVVAISKDILNPEMSIDDIIEKHFSDRKDSPGLREDLEEARKKAKEMNLYGTR